MSAVKVGSNRVQSGTQHKSMPFRCRDCRNMSLEEAARRLMNPVVIHYIERPRRKN